MKSSIDTRLREMESDDRSHFLIYQVLGVVRDAAWKYVKDRTGVDLLRILKKLAKENAPRT